MNITIPEEHDDTDADIAAAALTAADTKANGPRKPEWVCQHGLSHSLRSRAATDCQMSGCFNLASNIRSARPRCLAQHQFLAMPHTLLWASQSS